MTVLTKYIEKIRAFKAKHGLAGSEKDLAATIHLMSEHRIDKDKAIDQSSKSNTDHGIDGWYYNDDDKTLFIYQSKCSEVKNLVINGIDDLSYACDWLGQVIVDKQLQKTPVNSTLINLHRELSGKTGEINQINFTLISPYSESDLLTVNGYDKASNTFLRSPLIGKFHKQDIKISLNISPYNFSMSVPAVVKKYPVEKLPSATKKLHDGAQLHLAYLSLYSLVKLYEERGDVLFHKNVRMSLMPLKQTSRHRVISPMKQTFESICSGELDADIFPFFHGGITVYANSTEPGTHRSESLLEAPYVLNGCQTITIAHSYYKEIADDKIKLERFKTISVIAKIVESADSEVVREITICNNRQNPIEDWQLYSNDPVHCNIEFSLKDLGIFYERQKGKFESENKKTDFYIDYPNTNASYIDLEGLAQVIALCKREHQFTAKQSQIFSSKEHHQLIFSDDIHNYAKDMLYCVNLFKAVKRATEYAIYNVYKNQDNIILFKKPIVRAHLWWILLIYYYQRKNVFEKAATSLFRSASSSLVEEMTGIAERNIIRKSKSFIEKNLSVKGEVSVKKLTPFFEKELAVEIGIDLKNGVLPFTLRSRFNEN